MYLGEGWGHSPILLRSSLTVFAPHSAGVTYTVSAYLMTERFNYTSSPKFSGIYSFPMDPTKPGKESSSNYGKNPFLQLSQSESMGQPSYKKHKNKLRN